MKTNSQHHGSTNNNLNSKVCKAMQRLTSLLPRNPLLRWNLLCLSLACSVSEASFTGFGLLRGCGVSSFSWVQSVFGFEDFGLPPSLYSLCSALTLAGLRNQNLPLDVSGFSREASESHQRRKHRRGTISVGAASRCLCFQCVASVEETSDGSGLVVFVTFLPVTSSFRRSESKETLMPVVVVVFGMVVVVIIVVVVATSRIIPR